MIAVGNNVSKDKKFQTKISAAAIVNQAILRCQALGMPATFDNVIICVGDFFDPADPQYTDLIDVVMEMVAYTIGADIKDAVGQSY